jgi:hypothetical protein
MRKSVLIIAILLAAICFSSATAQEKRYPDSPRDVIIQLKTTGGDPSEIFSQTHVADFTLYGDGRVIYSRTDENQNQKLLEAKLDEKTINFLLDYVQSEGFFDLNENYLNLTVKDLETTTIRVRTSSKSKTVQVYGLLLATRQKMIPPEIFRIYRRFTQYQHDGEFDYLPQKISLIVSEFKNPIPKEAKVKKWKVQGIDLRDYSGADDSLTISYKETVFEDKDKDEILKTLKTDTLYGNRAGYFQTFYVAHKKAYKVAFRPHLPYE